MSPPPEPAAVSTLSVSEPVLPGSGLGMAFQELPLNCSISVRSEPLESWVVPTANTSSAPSEVIPFSLLPSLPALGAVTLDQAPPVECRMMGSSLFSLSMLPTHPLAHRLVALTAVTAVSSSMGLEPAFTEGVETTDQLVPFQCSEVKACELTSPTAHTLFAEIAVSPSMKPAPSAGGGTAVQLVPLYFANSGTMLPPPAKSSPAAQMSVGLTAAMAHSSSDPVLPPAGSGLGTIDQLVPFQCSMSVWSWSVEVLVLKPTAQPSPGATSATPSKLAVVPDGTGSCSPVHAVPFQWSANGPWTAAWVGFGPTASASVADAAETAVNPTSVVPATSGSGSGAGTTLKVGAAAAAAAVPGTAFSTNASIPAPQARADLRRS